MGILALTAIKRVMGAFTVRQDWNCNPFLPHRKLRFLQPFDQSLEAKLIQFIELSSAKAIPKNLIFSSSFKLNDLQSYTQHLFHDCIRNAIKYNDFSRFCYFVSLNSSQFLLQKSPYSTKPM